MKIINYLKKINHWLLISQLLILYVCLVNIFPKGYTFSGGDVFQFINLDIILSKMNYLWSNNLGEGIFLQNFSYSLFYHFINDFAKLFRLSSSSQSFIYYFIFLFGSFWSLYLSLNLFLEKESPNVKQSAKIVFSLLYTFNIYVFYNFFTIWGFSPFLFLYLLIPPLFGLTNKYFNNSDGTIDVKCLSLLVIIFCLTNISNGNFAFFISLNIFLLVFVTLIYATNYKRIKTTLFLKKILLFYIVELLAVAWSVFPQIIEMLRQLVMFQSGQSYFDIKGWILWQAGHFPAPFYIFQPQRVNNEIIYMASLLSVALPVCAFLAILISRRESTKRLVLIFSILLVLAMFVLNKGAGYIQPDIIWQIFKNPILSTLRSFDKSAIFLPFFFLIIIFLIYGRDFQKYHKIIYLLLVLSAISVFPFFIGGIQIKYSLPFKSEENYKTAKYSYINKIPQEYIDTGKELDSDQTDNKILRVPYNVINSIGWTNYTRWKQVGIDPTNQFFNKSNIEMNSPGAFGLWNYGLYWNKQSSSKSTWLLNFSGLLNADYLMYQKDIDPSFIRTTSDKISFYEKSGYITKIKTTDSFDLYKINKNFNLPHIYIPTNMVVSGQNINEISNLLSLDNNKKYDAIYFTNQNQDSINDAIKNLSSGTKSSPGIEYKKISPVTYKVIIRGVKDEFPIIFSESFHNGWRLYQSKINEEKGTGSFTSESLHNTIQNNNLTDINVNETWFKEPTSATHFQINGYSNGWIVNPSKECNNNSKCTKNADGSYNMEFVVEFWPQRLFYLGAFISASTFLGCTAYLIYNWRKKKKLKNVAKNI